MQLLILLSVVRVQKHWVPVVLLLLRLMFKITLGCYILQKTANLDKVLKMAMTLKQNVVFADQPVVNIVNIFCRKSLHPLLN